MAGREEGEGASKGVRTHGYGHPSNCGNGADGAGDSNGGKKGNCK